MLWLLGSPIWIVASRKGRTHPGFRTRVRWLLVPSVHTMMIVQVHSLPFFYCSASVLWYDICIQTWSVCGCPGALGCSTPRGRLQIPTRDLNCWPQVRSRGRPEGLPAPFPSSFYRERRKQRRRPINRRSAEPAPWPDRSRTRLFSFDVLTPVLVQLASRPVLLPIGSRLHTY